MRSLGIERTDSPGILDILLQPDFSVPDHLRPCCAFGYDLDVSVASLPIPPTQRCAEDNIHETLVVEFAPTSVVRTFAHERYRGKRRQ